jgi:hypothetical protein
MTRDELIAQKEALLQELSDINDTISAIIKRKNKEYEYSNIESTHRAKTHTLKELREMRDSIIDDISEINRQLGCTKLFTQIKS